VFFLFAGFFSLAAPVLGLAALLALRPVDQITAAARSISVQNLSQRISVPRTGDELQRMSETKAPITAGSPTSAVNQTRTPRRRL